jgi:soluble lytic murein transglycosylase-like protein
MKKLLFILLFLILLPPSFAGDQQYEPIPAATRLLLSHSISDIPPNINSFSSSTDENNWLDKEGKLIQNRIPDAFIRKNFLITVHYEAVRAGLDPDLILGLIQVESDFNKYAVSSVGARGFMQVMPFWINQIGNGQNDLFHLQTNLRFGCTILRFYLDQEHGNLFRALGRYNGSLGKAQYPMAVWNASLKYR